uniref:Uncharacterized protein n=1 Tax=Leptomonas pyrrhocoris qin-like virus TaxID=3070844 RepID=A0AA50KJ97_9VIRU|nr:hypothetical protein [Leptomonas pyrrhocoris qin-like virus]WMB96347.1 hypothetical protein [Leptomonas pyrrhocoris qin-like virus]
MTSSFEKNVSDFLAMCANGPVEVGLNATADRLTDAANFLYLPEKPDAKATLASVMYPVGLGDKARRVMAAMAGMCCSKQYGMAVSKDCVTRQAPTKTAEEVPALSSEDLHSAILLVYAAKVNWWQMNHHTGTRSTQASGFCAKAMAALGLDPMSAGDVQAIWIGSHWFDTRFILGVLGVLEPPSSGKGAWPPAAPEIMMRMKSNPAGTALWADASVVMDNLRSSMYKALIPKAVLIEHEGIKLTLEAVARNPARYHMGASYLVHEARKEIRPLSQTFKDVVGAAIGVVYPQGTISRSAALSNAACPRDSEYAQLFAGLKRTIATMGEAYGAMLAKRQHDDMDKGLTKEDWLSVIVEDDDTFGRRKIDERAKASIH